MDPRTPYLSVVLPCRNQADHIGRVMEGYREPLGALGRPYELVVVPNACTDDTEAIVRRAAEFDPRIRVLANPAGGWGRSVRMGLDASRGRILCYTNSARTDPVQIPQLLAVHSAGPEGIPLLAKVRRERRGAPAREVGSWLFNLEARMLFGFSLSDVNGTPKMFSREVYRRAGLAEDGDLLDLEFVAKAHRLGVRVVEMPVAGFKRHGGTSSTNLLSAWNLYTGAIGLRWALSGYPKSQAGR